MTRGLTRTQIGVTEQMIVTYGEHIWELSHNIQVRRGDSVRELDWAQIEAQRPATGLADIEIAERIGLSHDQVTFIRLVLERRKFRRGNYYRLLELGGGRRFRAERFTPHPERGTFSPTALALRSSLKFDPDLANRYLRLGFWTADTVSGLVEHWAEQRPDQIAVIDNDATVSYLELRDRARRLANAFLALGLQRGDVVAFQISHGAAFGIAFAAISMMGGVAAILPPPAGDDELEPLLKQVQARAVICRAAKAPDDPAKTIQRLKKKIASLDHIIVAGSKAPKSMHALNRLIESGAETGAIDLAVAADPAVVLFGNDRTRPTETIVHCSHTLLSSSRALAPAYRLTSDDVILSAVPFADALGLWSLNLALGVGVPIVAIPPQADLSEALAAQRPTIVFITADQLTRWAKTSGAARFDTVRLVTILDVAYPEEAALAVKALLPNATLGQAWGRGEFFVGLHTPFADGPTTGLTSIGMPPPNVEARIVSPKGATQPNGQDGLIDIRGGALFAGYLDNEAATREMFADDGWFRTDVRATTGSDGGLRLIQPTRRRTAVVS